eukprot:1158449-Pelagomonas_calceolata.AAC.8
MQICWLKSKLEGACILTVKSSKGATPRPGPSRIIHKGTLMKFASSGAVMGTWTGAIGQLLSAAWHDNMSCNFAYCSGSHQTWDPW